MAILRSRSGLTLFETLVMIAITALIGSVVMNVGARANAGNFDRANRVAAAQSMQIAEDELRRAAREVVLGSAGVDVRGDRASVTIGLVGFEACGLSRNEAQFAIQARSDGGSLVRRCAGRSPKVIARWPSQARADFSYSTDGIVWASSFPGEAAAGAAPLHAVFVRLRVRAPGGVENAFIVRGVVNAAESGADEVIPPGFAP